MAEIWTLSTDNILEIRSYLCLDFYMKKPTIQSKNKCVKNKPILFYLPRPYPGQIWTDLVLSWLTDPTDWDFQHKEWVKVTNV